MNAFEERLSKCARHYPHLYDKSCGDYKGRTSQILRERLGKQWDAARGRLWWMAFHLALQPSTLKNYIHIGGFLTSFGLCPAFVARQKVMVELVDVTCLTFMQKTRSLHPDNGHSEPFSLYMRSDWGFYSHITVLLFQERIPPQLCLSVTFDDLRFLDVSVQNRINNKGEYPAW